MKDDKNKGEAQTATLVKNAKKALKDPRQDRLKLALRENLKRRKTQARGRGDTNAASSGQVVAPLHDENKTAPDEKS